MTHIVPAIRFLFPGLALVELIPFVGPAVSALLGIFAFGAAVMAFWDWRRGTAGTAAVRLACEEVAAPETGKRAA
jgi:hypothetical protein